MAQVLGLLALTEDLAGIPGAWLQPEQPQLLYVLGCDSVNGRSISLSLFQINKHFETFPEHLNCFCLDEGFKVPVLSLSTLGRDDKPTWNSGFEICDGNVIEQNAVRPSLTAATHPFLLASQSGCWEGAGAWHRSVFLLLAHEAVQLFPAFGCGHRTVCVSPLQAHR